MLNDLFSTAPWWAWVGFHLLIFLMLALDLGIFNRKAHAPSVKEAAAWSTVWVILSLIFNAVVWKYMGPIKGVEWMTGYLLEKSLSVDNLFVFVLIFTSFRVELRHQHRVLYWGVLGALLMRAVMILAGTALLIRFAWMVWVFGGFLVWTGLKMLLLKEEHAPDPTKGKVAQLFQKFVPFDPNGGHEHFWTRVDGKRLATPMLLILAIVEVTDLVFAVDSIPAVLAVTRDPFVVYTSNIFAILGLRSLYFLLAKMVDRFHRLKTGLAVILVYVGVKMCIAEWIKIPTPLSLAIIAALLAVSIGASLAWPAKGRES